MISEIAGKWEIIILLEILYFCDAQFGCLLLIFVRLFFSNDSVDREEETIGQNFVRPRFQKIKLSF